jgi:Fe-S cluster assembly protein SufD
MNALERMLDEFDAQAAQAAPSAARLAAAQSLRAQGLPTRRDENWHYANLRALESVQRFVSAAPPVAPAAAPLPPLPAPLEGYTRLVFVDGRLWPGSPWPGSPGITRLPFETSVAAEPAAPFSTSGDGRLGLTARLFAPEALALRLAGTVALEIISVSTSPIDGCYTDLVLDIAAGAQVALVEQRLTAASLPATATVPLTATGTQAAVVDGHNLRLRLEAGASLVHTRLQQTAEHVVQHDSLAAIVGERASYRLRQVTAGGASARSSVQVQLAGREAAFDLRALAAARGTQVADAQFTILHEAPGTRSDQLFRGIASDRAHVACSADVQVAATARGARVQQSLRGLIGGKGAEVDLRPRLTINTDEIQATHGATTGQLDENLLFYLLSRGLDDAAARSLLKWAFLGEALGAIDPPALRRAAGLAAAARLSDAPAAELLQ